MVSSSFLRHYDETKTLLKSQHQICAIGADGEQIEMTSHDKSVFVNMDPVLVRLALRNLLDNALKYSSPQSLIQFCILQREDLLGTSFTVTSQLAAADLLDETIFLRRARGEGAEGRGSGLGLYLVKKVAEAHGGSVSFLVHDNATVTFDLFLPD